MRKFTFYVYLFTCLLFAACSDYDDSAIWDELNEQAARIAALEKWQETVNGNITALQGIVTALQENDYVTGVTPFESPTPGGIRITFTKSGEVTVWNGTEGATPVVDVREFPEGSGTYYWIVDNQDGDGPQWVTDGDGNKIPVTDQTPQVRIDSGTETWQISTDGGQTWTDTGVRATGDSGDSIFAANGVDNAHADYVVFTLADGTEFTLPRYKALGISVGQTDTFDYGQTQRVPYTLTGDVSGGVVVFHVPDGWKVTVDAGTQEIVVTAPIQSDVNDNNRNGSVLLLVGDGDGNTAIRILDVALPELSADPTVSYCYPDKAAGTGVPGSTIRVGSTEVTVEADGTWVAPLTNTYYPGDLILFYQQETGKEWSPGFMVTVGSRPDGPESNEIGALYYRNQYPIGVVFLPKTTTTHGLVVSLNEADDYNGTGNGLYWGPYGVVTDATDQNNGRNNMATIKALDADFTDYPAFEWVHTKNQSGVNYTESATDVWYLPSVNELKALYAGFCGLNFNDMTLWTGWSRMPGYDDQSSIDGRAKFNSILTAAGGNELETGSASWPVYRSSTELGSQNAYCVEFDGGFGANNSKSGFVNAVERVRAILAFE